MQVSIQELRKRFGTEQEVIAKGSLRQFAAGTHCFWHILVSWDLLQTFYSAWVDENPNYDQYPHIPTSLANAA